MYLAGTNIGYQPYRMGGALASSIKLKTLAGLSGAEIGRLGEIPVVIVKEEASVNFMEQVKRLMPFAVTMLGVSIVSSLAIYGITKALEGKRPRLKSMHPH